MFSDVKNQRMLTATENMKILTHNKQIPYKKQIILT